MARTITDATTTTRAARAKLELGTHWRSVDPDVHLGYRRGSRGGRWLVRWRLNGTYQQQIIGTADDVLDGDGVHAFSYIQAMAAARKTISEKREHAIIKAAGPIVTVRNAVEDYIEEREARERLTTGGVGMKRDCRSRLSRHVLKEEMLAERALHSLSAQDLKAWQDGISKALAQTTRRRLINDLKAALNRASGRGLQLPPTFERVVKGGLASSQPTPPAAREMQVLTDNQIRAVVAAAMRIDARGEWGGALEQMIVILAATGARFSQVARITVADVQVPQSRILIPTSRKGRGTKRLSHIPVPVGPDVLAILKPASTDKAGKDLLLLRPRWRQVDPKQWQKTGVEQWTDSSGLTRPWRAIIAEAGLPAGTVPYALRHSAIVRGLRVGLPTRLVAATHDTSVAMIESHYAAYVVSALEELSSRSIISLS